MLYRKQSWYNNRVLLLLIAFSGISGPIGREIVALEGSIGGFSSCSLAVRLPHQLRRCRAAGFSTAFSLFSASSPDNAPKFTNAPLRRVAFGNRSKEIDLIPGHGKSVSGL